MLKKTKKWILCLENELLFGYLCILVLPKIPLKIDHPTRKKENILLRYVCISIYIYLC